MVLLWTNRAKFLTSIFKGDGISEFSVQKQRLRVEITKQSYEEQLKNDRGLPPGFVVVGPEHLKFKHETQTATKTKKKEKEKPIIEPILVQARYKKSNFAVL